MKIYGKMDTLRRVIPCTKMHFVLELIVKTHQFQYKTPPQEKYKYWLKRGLDQFGMPRSEIDFGMVLS